MDACSKFALLAPLLFSRGFFSRKRKKKSWAGNSLHFGFGREFSPRVFGRCFPKIKGPFKKKHNLFPHRLSRPICVYILSSNNGQLKHSFFGRTRDAREGGMRKTRPFFGWNASRLAWVWTGGETSYGRSSFPARKRRKNIEFLPVVKSVVDWRNSETRSGRGKWVNNFLMGYSLSLSLSLQQRSTSIVFGRRRNFGTQRSFVGTFGVAGGAGGGGYRLHFSYKTRGLFLTALTLERKLCSKMR